MRTPEGSGNRILPERVPLSGSAEAGFAGRPGESLPLSRARAPAEDGPSNLGAGSGTSSARPESAALGSTPPPMRWTSNSTGPRVRRAARRRCAVLWVALLAGCSDSGKPVVEAGTTFFDLLPHLRIESSPETNLPPEIASLVRGAAPFRTREIATSDWIYGGTPPEPLRSGLPKGSRVLFWQYLPPVALAPGGETPRPVRQGSALPSWDPSGQDFPGEAVWWDPKEGCLFALSEAPPVGVRLECTVDAAAELGDLEGRLLRPPEPGPRAAERPAGDLVGALT